MKRWRTARGGGGPNELANGDSWRWHRRRRRGSASVSAGREMVMCEAMVHRRGGGPTGYGRQSMAGAGTRRSAMRHMPAALRACRGVGRLCGRRRRREAKGRRRIDAIWRDGTDRRGGDSVTGSGFRGPVLLRDALALRKSFTAIRMNSGLAPPRRQSCSTQKKGGPKAAPYSRTIRDSFSCLILPAESSRRRPPSRQWWCCGHRTHRRRRWGSRKPQRP